MSNEEYLNNMNVQYSPEENEDNYEKTAAVKENNSTNQASQSKNKSNITDKKDKPRSIVIKNSPMAN